MKIIRDLKEYQNKEPNLVVAFGNFDGVHFGHRKLLQLLKQKAQEINGKAAVFTFFPHPLQVLRPEMDLKLLLEKEDKESILTDLGIDYLFSIPFSKAFSKMMPEIFITKVIEEALKARGVVVGYNFNFGYKGMGDVLLLKTTGMEKGFFVEVLPPVYCCNQKVSSTLIRQYLLQGNIKEATNLLGYFPFLNGQVVYGEGRGKEIGFPTANVNLPVGLLVPRDGVYIVRISVDGQVYQGVANIGCKPTFHKNGEKNLEIHFFNFNKDIYNKEVKVEFLDYMRSEKSFVSCNELIDQIKRDIIKAKEFFRLSLA